MINKIKELVKLTEKLDKLNGKLENNEKRIEGIEGKIDNSEKQLNDIVKTTKELIDTNQNFSDKFTETNEKTEQNNRRFQTLLNEFSLLKSQLPEKIFEHLDTEVRPHLDRLRTDLKEFDSLNKNLNLINSDMKSIQGEISKFRDIAKNIKAGDFDLVKFKKTLETEDRNKLALMKEVDDMKRLIERERRRH